MQVFMDTSNELIERNGVKSRSNPGQHRKSNFSINPTAYWIVVPNEYLQSKIYQLVLFQGPQYALTAEKEVIHLQQVCQE
jgi:hypothetical protein